MHRFFIKFENADVDFDPKNSFYRKYWFWCAFWSKNHGKRFRNHGELSKWNLDRFWMDFENADMDFDPKNTFFENIYFGVHFCSKNHGNRSRNHEERSKWNFDRFWMDFWPKMALNFPGSAHPPIFKKLGREDLSTDFFNFCCKMTFGMCTLRKNQIRSDSDL